MIQTPKSPIPHLLAPWVSRCLASVASAPFGCHRSTLLFRRHAFVQSGARVSSVQRCGRALLLRLQHGSDGWCPTPRPSPYTPTTSADQRTGGPAARRRGRAVQRRAAIQWSHYTVLNTANLRRSRCPRLNAANNANARLGYFPTHRHLTK